VAHVGEERNACRFLMENSKGKGPPVRPKLRWEVTYNLRREDFANPMFGLSTSFSGEFTETFHVIPFGGSTRSHNHTNYRVFRGCCC
jgi:hypothetical protein